MEWHLWAKALLYTTAFQCTPMNHWEAGVLYCSCFIPALAYPLPATWLPDAFFDKVHQLSTSMVLNKMGYHRNLPCSMVLALQAMGGVSMCNFQYEMEVQQIIILLCHMHAHTPLSNMVELLLPQYQLWAGISQLVLMDMSLCPWVLDRWISQICQTLHEHNMQIQHKAWLICPLWCNDIFLMEVVNELGLTIMQLECINACRMYLQVTMLVEVVDHTKAQYSSHKPLAHQKWVHCRGLTWSAPLN